MPTSSGARAPLQYPDRLRGGPSHRDKPLGLDRKHAARPPSNSSTPDLGAGGPVRRPTPDPHDRPATTRSRSCHTDPPADTRRWAEQPGRAVPNSACSDSLASRSSAWLPTSRNRLSASRRSCSAARRCRASRPCSRGCWPRPCTTERCSWSSQACSQRSSSSVTVHPSGRRQRSRRPTRIALDRPLQALWQTIGAAGHPPRDHSRQFATYAVILLVLAWIVVPVAIAIAYAVR